MWSAFRAGAVPALNERVAAEFAAVLPESAWRPSKARPLRQPLISPQPGSAVGRVLPGAGTAEGGCRVSSAQERRVWCDHGIDGMSWLTAYLPLAVAQRDDDGPIDAAAALASLPCRRCGDS